jgi:integrase
MENDLRTNRDFSKGPVWNPAAARWLVEVRYPNGTRLRKRFRSERAALRCWSAAATSIENGTWDQSAAKNVILEKALTDYRAYSRVQNRSHESYVEPALKLWERELTVKLPLARVNAKQIEAVKLRRAGEVVHSTVDKDLGVLKAFFNWCIAQGFAASNPVCKVKFFNDNNERCRYLTDDEWERLRTAAPAHEDHSAYLLDKMVLARNTGLRRANLFRAQWTWIDWMNRVIRVPRTKNNKSHAVPLNATAYETLARLFASRDTELDSPYVFCHPRDTKHAGKPVLDVKNAFHAALRTAKIHDFTWHDFRHDFASRLVMAGVSLRAVAELLGHKGLRMVMRYAYLSPGYLSDEIHKLDGFRLRPSTAAAAATAPPSPAPEPPSEGPPRAKGKKRAKRSTRRGEASEICDFVRKSGSSGWIRTSNPPVNSRMLCR